MVGMPMGVNHRIEPVHVFSHGLGAEIGRGVDHHIAPGIGKQNRGAHALVERVA